MTGKPYNGHPSWTAWNVSLWIANDEGLYNQARGWLKHVRTTRPIPPFDKMAPKARAAELMLGDLRAAGITATPDGARYSKTSILHAMRGLE